VEHETTTPAGSSSPVTLCASKCRLSLLVVSPDDNDVFTIQAEYSTVRIVCWKLHFADRQRCHVAYLSITVAPDDNPANCNDASSFVAITTRSYRTVNSPGPLGGDLIG